MSKKCKLTVVVCILSLLSLVAYVGVRAYKAYYFNFNCEQHIKQATNAATVEIASKELQKAISYAEDNGLTEGNTGVFFCQPKNDVEFWYQNMVAAHNELENLAEGSTALEKTNVLMKVRESLTYVTPPADISVYPHQKLYFWWYVTSLILLLV